MNWAEIKNLFVNSVGQAASAASEAYIHLDEGYRQVCSRMDVRELESTDESIVTTTGIDFGTLPTNVFSIIQVDDVSNGLRLAPEPSGMRGRSQYLDANSGSPSLGRPLFYDVTGERIYFRPTPDDNYRIRIRYKIKPPAVTEEVLDESPLLPEHLHVAIVYAAAVSYYNTHPDANKEMSSIGATSASLMQQALDKKLADPMLPKDRERFDQSGRIVIPGFSHFRF